MCKINDVKCYGLIRFRTQRFKKTQRFMMMKITYMAADLYRPVVLIHVHVPIFKTEELHVQICC